MKFYEQSAGLMSNPKRTLGINPFIVRGLENPNSDLNHRVTETSDLPSRLRDRIEHEWILDSCVTGVKGHWT
jgi:hypothetical protein